MITGEEEVGLTVQQVHQRPEDAVSSRRHLRLGDCLALPASPHLLQQPPHLLHGAVDLGADAGKYFEIEYFTKNILYSKKKTERVAGSAV